MANKPKKNGNKPIMNEMGWALTIAVGLLLFFLIITRLSSTPKVASLAEMDDDDDTMAAAIQKITRPPSLSSKTGGVDPMLAEGPTPIAPEDEDPMLAEGPTPIAPLDDDPMLAEGPTPIAPQDEDPMLAEGPTPIAPEDEDPMLAEGPTPIAPLEEDPMLAEGPTPIAPPDETVLTTPLAVATTLASTTVASSVGNKAAEPWPRGVGSQPPTPNPVIREIFDSKTLAVFASNEQARSANEEELRSRYGGECSDALSVGYHCWNRTDTPPAGSSYAGVRRDQCLCKESGCCTRKGRNYEIDHRFDNLTNSEVIRKDFCSRLRRQTTNKLIGSAELYRYINLTAFDEGILQPLPSGKSVGDLSYDPAVVQSHVFKAQTALAVYAEGTKPFTDKQTSVRPAPDEAEYTAMVNALARRFAAALIRGGDFVVAGLGDSTMAGADNCYYDNFLSVLERQMKPLLAAAKVNFTVRNCGHNGGFNSQEQMSCAGTMLGTDADIAIISWPFVKPTNSEPGYELLIRRFLATGSLTHISGDVRKQTCEWILPGYSRFGVTCNPGGYGGYGDDNGRWWPNKCGKCAWGRIGDGLCHTDLTRSGSAPVHSRNWHPGPQGHQAMADRFAFLYMTAITQALEMIKVDLHISKGKLGPLLAKYRGRDDVASAVDNWPKTPVTCDSCRTPDTGADIDGYYPAKPGCATLCPSEGMLSGLDRIFPVCLSALRPVFGGPTWVDWIVTDESTENLIIARSPHSSLGPTGWSSVVAFETPRPAKQCEHLDTESTLQIIPDKPTIIKVPKEKIILGIVGSCVFCNDKGKENGKWGWQTEVAPNVQMQFGPTGKVHEVPVSYSDNQTLFEFEAGHHGRVQYKKKSASCFTLKDKINCHDTTGLSCASDSRTPAVDILIHIKCPSSQGGEIQYFWVW